MGAGLVIRTGAAASEEAGRGRFNTGTGGIWGGANRLTLGGDARKQGKNWTRLSAVPGNVSLWGGEELRAWTAFSEVGPVCEEQGPLKEGGEGFEPTATCV